MAPISGTLATQSETASKRPDIADLRLLEKSAARFLGLLTDSKRRIRRLKNSKYEVQERRPRGTVTQIDNGGGYNNSATTLTLDSNTHLTVGDYLYLPASSEMIKVTAVDSGGTDITVVRGVGTTAATMSDDAYVVRLARGAEEGYTIGSSFITGTTQVTNYAGIITTPVSWTNLELQEWSYLGKGQKESRMMADREAMAIEHLKDIERMLLVSEKSTATSSSKVTRTTEGLIPSCVTYRTDHGGAADITHAEYRADFVTNLFRNGDSMEKVGFHSLAALEIVEGFGLGLNQYFPDEKKEHELGFPVTKYRTSKGYIDIIHHPLMDDLTTYTDEAVIGYDQKQVRLALLEDTKYNENMQPRNEKRRLDEWCTIVGLEVTYEETLVYVYDMAA